MDKYGDEKAKLYDIARSIEEVSGLVAGMRFEDFRKETQIRDEVSYQLREIGIAVGLLSLEFKEMYGDVDWDVLGSLQFATWDQEMEIDPNALWYIIENDLPRLHDQIYDITVMLQDKEDEQFFY